MPLPSVENRVDGPRDHDENSARSVDSWPQRAALSLIWFYQSAISPFTPKSCRFEPTCSHYAQQAIARFGVLNGGKLALKRICRCHPWGAFGFDPVPEHVSKSSSDKTSNLEALAVEVGKASKVARSSTRCVKDEQNAL